MLAKEVETLLNRCFAAARTSRHENLTVDHLFLELLTEAAVVDYLVACSVDVDALRTELRTRVLKTRKLRTGDENDTQPTLAFQRVLQRAVFFVQARGEHQVVFLDVLQALLREKGKSRAGDRWDEIAKTKILDNIEKATARRCPLCDTLVPERLLTAIGGRGELCADCIAAVLAVNGNNGSGG